MDVMNPKSPSELPKAEHLRRKANELKGRAERLIEEADELLAEAERLENSSKNNREDVNQAAVRNVRQATE